MTKGEFSERMHREIHITWKHVCWIIGSAATAWVALASTTAVNTRDIANHQRTLDERAPAVAELARVSEQVKSEAKAADRFRDDVRDSLNRIERKQDRIEDKLDRALQK